MRTVLAAFTALTLATSALAQEPTLQGIGFAQAEEGTWHCLHHEPGEALACAREHCLEQAPDQECAPTAWCYPARWSGTMTLWLSEFHTTQVLCGMPDEATLQEVLAGLCWFNKDATSCDLTLIVDPDGKEQVVEGITFPGGASDDGSNASGKALQTTE
jgi:hypothetical protein